MVLAVNERLRRAVYLNTSYRPDRDELNLLRINTSTPL
jgi:hypothetical protein